MGGRSAQVRWGWGRDNVGGLLGLLLEMGLQCAGSRRIVDREPPLVKPGALRRRLGQQARASFMVWSSLFVSHKEIPPRYDV